MLIIEPTTDGRLRLQNSHRSEFARDESAARTLAYNWGHTDISINKALSEMRASARGEARPSGWRATPKVEGIRAVAERGASAPEKSRAGSPVAAEGSKSVARPRRQRAAGSEPAAAPVPTAAAPASAAKVRARRGKVEKPAGAPTTRKSTAQPPKPRRTPGEQAARVADKRLPREQDARERALAHFRAGVKDLVGLERSTLAFARGPWSDLREMADHITACLEGKRPKTGWVREGK